MAIFNFLKNDAEIRVTDQSHCQKQLGQGRILIWDQLPFFFLLLAVMSSTQSTSFDTFKFLLVSVLGFCWFLYFCTSVLHIFSYSIPCFCPKNASHRSMGWKLPICHYFAAKPEKKTHSQGRTTKQHKTPLFWSTFVLMCFCWENWEFNLGFTTMLHH